MSATNDSWGDDVEVLCMKKIVVKLQEAIVVQKCVSFFISPHDTIGSCLKIINILFEEETRGRSRCGRLSFLSAMTSAQQKLKLYSKIPPTGLAIFCGTIVERGKEKKISYDIVPKSSIRKSEFNYTDRFHVKV